VSRPHRLLIRLPVSRDPKGSALPGSKSTPQGWVFLDVLVGLLILSIIGLTLGAGAAWHQRALGHLADTRAASRLAESALTSLQAGQHLSTSGVHYHALAGKQQISGMSWIEVSATFNGRSATLVGLVPSQSVAGGGS
jgi:hypothetical protein